MFPVKRKLLEVFFLTANFTPERQRTDEVN